MTEHPHPFHCFHQRFRWWFRDIGPYGPWASEYSFNAGRTWHRLVGEAFTTARDAGELQTVDQETHR